MGKELYYLLECKIYSKSQSGSDQKYIFVNNVGHI